jgi:flagellar motor switch/type III secretory pathway protein FliN
MTLPMQTATTYSKEITSLVNSASFERFDSYHLNFFKNFIGHESRYRNYIIRWENCEGFKPHNPIVFSCDCDAGKFLIIFDRALQYEHDQSTPAGSTRTKTISQLFLALLHHSPFLNALENGLQLKIEVLNQLPYQTSLIDKHCSLAFKIRSLERSLSSGLISGLSHSMMELLAQRANLVSTRNSIKKKLLVNTSIMISGVQTSSTDKNNLKTGTWICLIRNIIESPINVLLLDEQENIFFKAQANLSRRSIEVKENLYEVQTKHVNNSGNEPMLTDHIDGLQKTDIVSDKDPMAGYSIRLQFEIGRLNLTIDELSKLAPGHIIALDRVLDEQSVHIYSNNTLVAKGELALLDHALCVRVSSIEQ